MLFIQVTRDYDDDERRTEDDDDGRLLNPLRGEFTRRFSSDDFVCDDETLTATFFVAYTRIPLGDDYDDEDSSSTR